MSTNKKPRFDLLVKAYHFIKAIPDENFDLDQVVFQFGEYTKAEFDHCGFIIKVNTYVDEYPSKFNDVDTHINCGTIACAAGWLGLNPEFRKRGLVMDDSGTLYFKRNVKTEHFRYDLYGNLANFFHIDKKSAISLFQEGNTEFRRAKKKTTHKQIFLNRMKNFFKRNQINYEEVK